VTKPRDVTVAELQDPKFSRDIAKRTARRFSQSHPHIRMNCAEWDSLEQTIVAQIRYGVAGAFGYPFQNPLGVASDSFAAALAVRLAK
jgi:hypothetical protein